MRGNRCRLQYTGTESSFAEVGECVTKVLNEYTVASWQLAVSSW